MDELDHVNIRAPVRNLEGIRVQIATTLITSIGSDNDDNSHDEEHDQAIRYLLGTFMLIVTLFVFFFAIFTYRKHLKRMIGQVRFYFH